jgi:hypothetical protein
MGVSLKDEAVLNTFYTMLTVKENVFLNENIPGEIRTHIYGSGGRRLIH